MLKSFRFENFKSFEKAELPLAPLTVLIGANASGKSNAIEGIQLLSWLAKGRRLEDLYEALGSDELWLRGGLQQLIRKGSTSNHFGLGCAFEIADEAAYEFLLEISALGGDLQVLTEKMTRQGSEEAVYQTGRLPDTKHGIVVHSKSFSDFSLGGFQVAFPHLESIAHLGSDRKIPSLPPATLQTDLSSAFFLEPEPQFMRGYGFKTPQSLRRNGSNLSTVLYNLTSAGDKPSAVLDFICSLPEQNIESIQFIETPRGDVMVQLKEKFSGTSSAIDADVLSDGTLRVLAIAAALLSVPEDTLVVIEEIDNGVHPSRAKELLAQMQKVIKERNLQVLATTHNPALLDALPPEAVQDAVACYRDPEDGSSKLVRLGDLYSFPELVAQGPLGHVVTEGILDSILKDPTTPEEKVQKNLEWLEELKASIAGR